MTWTWKWRGHVEKGITWKQGWCGYRDDTWHRNGKKHGNRDDVETGAWKRKYHGNGDDMEMGTTWTREWHGNWDNMEKGMTRKWEWRGNRDDTETGMTWGVGGGGGRIGQRGIGGDYESNYEGETNRRDSDNSAKEYTGLDNADTTCIPATGASTCYCSCLSRRSVDRVLDALRYEWKLGLCASLTIWNKRSSTFLQKNERKKVRDSLFVPM